MDGNTLAIIIAILHIYMGLAVRIFFCNGYFGTLII